MLHFFQILLFVSVIIWTFFGAVHCFSLDPCSDKIWSPVSNRMLILWCFYYGPIMWLVVIGVVIFLTLIYLWDHKPSIKMTLFISINNAYKKLCKKVEEIDSRWEKKGW